MVTDTPWSVLLGLPCITNFSTLYLAMLTLAMKVSWPKAAMMETFPIT